MIYEFKLTNDFLLEIKGVITTINEQGLREAWNYYSFDNVVYHCRESLEIFLYVVDKLDEQHVKKFIDYVNSDTNFLD